MIHTYPSLQITPLDDSLLERAGNIISVQVEINNTSSGWKRPSATNGEIST